MKSSMGKLVKQVLSNPGTAKILSSAIISNYKTSTTIKVTGVLDGGKTLILKRVHL